MPFGSFLLAGDDGERSVSQRVGKRVASAVKSAAMRRRRKTGHEGGARAYHLLCLVSQEYISGASSSTMGWAMAPSRQQPKPRPRRGMDLRCFSWGVGVYVVVEVGGGLLCCERGVWAGERRIIASIAYHSCAKEVGLELKPIFLVLHAISLEHFLSSNLSSNTFRIKRYTNVTERSEVTQVSPTTEQTGGLLNRRFNTHSTSPSATEEMTPEWGVVLRLKTQDVCYATRCGKAR